MNDHTSLTRKFRTHIKWLKALVVLSAPAFAALPVHTISQSDPALSALDANGNDL